MQKEKLARMLPEIFQATVGASGPLDAFLAAQEGLHNPCEDEIRLFPERLDPRRTPPRFVYMLAHWMDLDYLLDGPEHALHFAPGVGRLRELIATAAQHARERGTEKALIQTLEKATGCLGFGADAQNERPFHFKISAPESARPFEDIVWRIIEAEKPAFATYELSFYDHGSSKEEESKKPEK